MCSVKPPNDLSDKGHAVEEWLDLRFFRPIGIRIARALYPTGISPDQVTLWSILIGLVAGHLFAYRDRWTDLIGVRSEEHTSELQSLAYLVCRLLLEKKKNFIHRVNTLHPRVS